MNISPAWAQIARSEFRQEFINHHLSSVRKGLNACRKLQEYRLRHKCVRRLNLAIDCLPETAELLENRCAEINLDNDQIDPLMRVCLDRFQHAEISDELSQSGKKYYLDLLNEVDYDPSSAYMKFGLNERLLKTVAAYLGQAPYLQSIELMLSRPFPQEPELTRSQLWHCDNNNDRHLLKLFLYITDVSDVNGPLTFLPRSESEKIPWYAGHYISDERIRKYVSLDKRFEFKGAAGSAFMMDSASLYHFGSRCMQPRLTFVLHFNSGFGYFPRNTNHLKWTHKQKSLSEIQRLAVGYR